MASYQNTSGYCGGIPENTHPGYYPYPNAYFNQNPTNFHTNAAYYPEIIHNTGNINGYVPQYNTIQYTPRTQHPVYHQEPRNQYKDNRHHAHITILPSSKPTFKAPTKPKRKRTKFTTDQVEALEAIFRNQQYVSRDERLVIVNQLRLNDKAVKTWFQNRRLKNKSMHNSDSEPSSSSVTDHRDFAEPHISKKTDGNGVVTVDDGDIRDLVDVLDEFLRENSAEVPVAESDNSSFYEAISPAAVSDNTEEDNCLSWSPSEPKESLKMLFDLKAMMLL